MNVTDVGIDIDDRELQPEKIDADKSEIEVGNETDLMLDSENAAKPIESTDVGITTESKFLQL
jgi:hypothetical protein